MKLLVKQHHGDSQQYIDKDKTRRNKGEIEGGIKMRKEEEKTNSSH